MTSSSTAPPPAEPRQRASDIHGVATEPIELGDDQHVTDLEPIDESGEAGPLSDGDAPRDRLGDDATRLDLEAGRLDFGELVVDGLNVFRSAWRSDGQRDSIACPQGPLAGLTAASGLGVGCGG